MKRIKIILLSANILMTTYSAEAQNNAQVTPLESAIHPDYIQKAEKKIPADSITAVKSDKTKLRSKRVAIAAAVFIGTAAISSFTLMHLLENVVDNANNKTIHFTI